MESTLTMASRSKFINTFGCGAGFTWLLARTTHLHVYLDTRSSMAGCGGGYIYTTAILIYEYMGTVWLCTPTCTPWVHADLNNVPLRCDGNLASLLWLWQTPAPPLAESTPLGCSTPQTWSSTGNLRTSLAALATDDI